MSYKDAIPFLDQDTLGEVFQILLEKEKYEEIADIAYALSSEKLEELYAVYVEKGIDTTDLLPFLSNEFLRQMVLEEVKKL